MIINYHAEMHYARIISSDAGLEFHVEQGLTTPYTDFAGIYVPPMNPLWEVTSFDYKMWWFYVIHECFHNKHKDDLVVMKEKNIDTGSFLGTVHNIVVDFKIETRNRGEYAGRDKIVHDARYAFASEKIYGNMAHHSDNGGRSDKLQAVWVLDSICRIPWIPKYATDELERLLSPQGLVFLETLLRWPNLLEKYSEQETGLDSYEVTSEIVKALDEIGESDGDGSGDGEVELPQEGEGAADSKEGDGEANESGKKWVKFSELLMDDHAESPSGCKEGMSILYDALDYGPSDAWVPMDIEETDLSANRCAFDLTPEPFVTGISKCQLSKSIRRELQVFSRQRWESQQKRGRLHSKSLHKVSVGSDKVFRKKSNKKTTKELAIMVLTDCSGSMCGHKYENAAVASHAIAEVAQALQTKVGVYGFTTHSKKTNYIHTFKAFEKKLDTTDFVERFCKADKMMFSNADGDCLLWGASKLLSVKASRRIMFVLSDGSPAGSDRHGNRSDALYSFTKKVIKDIENNSPIEVYAIGIEDSNVEDLYANSVVINDSRELEGKLLTVLRNKVINEM